MPETSGIAPTASRETWIVKLSLTGARVVFWSLALLTLVVVAVQFGAWQEEIRLTGPFASETAPPTRSLILTVPEQRNSSWWRQPLIGDSLDKPLESRLKLSINGISMGPAHTVRALIRAGVSLGYVHWERDLIFSLPPGVDNAATTTAVLRFAVEPRSWVPLVCSVATVLLGWLLYRDLIRRHLPSRAIARQAAVAVEILYIVLLALFCLGLVGVALFAISSAYALASGWTFPTIAIIRWWSVARWAAVNELYLPYLLLALAGLGIAATWLTGLHQTEQTQFERREARLQRFLIWAGFPIAIGAFVFCLSAMWSGQVRPGDLESSSMGGLIPFSDAFGYFAAAFDQARDGYFNDFSMRRPYATALRSNLLFFSQNSFPAMLLLQACLLGTAAWWAACAVMTWRGVWSGVAFFSLTYIYARIFAPTTLTEPLGLFWALLSIPFFIASFRTSSVRPALVGFALTVFALLTRMGNMFAIPALMLWLVWQFGRGMADKARIGVVTIGILLAAIGLNSLLQKTYGTASSSTGSNFSYTLCGLTLGTTWEGCPKKLEEVRGPDAPVLSEQAMAAQMYVMAWDNFRAHPEVLFQRLGKAIKEFSSRYPRLMWRGYAERIEEPGWFPRHALTLLILAGLWFAAARRANSVELSFWALFCFSLTASAAVVYFDDGGRVLAASQPLVALLFATGLTNPYLKVPDVQHNARLTFYGTLGVLVAAVLLAAVPWIAHRAFPAPALTGGTTPLQKDDVLVYGGRKMFGFLVVADGEPLRNDIPTIHLSNFSAIVELSHAEEVYQGLLNPVAPPLPFGFVTAPRMERGVDTNYIYIVPAEVMERRDVPAWRFATAPWNHKKDVKGNYWVNVTAATPQMLKGQ